MGEPISINTHQTRVQMIRSGIFKPTSPTSFTNPTRFRLGTNHHSKGKGDPLQGQPGYQGPKLKKYTEDSIEKYTEVRRYEEDKLEERVRKGEEQQKAGIREAFEDLIAAMNLNRIQNLSKEGAAADPLVQILTLVSRGMLVPVPITEPNGNYAIRYEPRNLAMPQTQLQNGNAYGGGLATADILKIIETAFDKRNEILIKYIEAMERENHIKELELAKRFADSGNLHQTTGSGAQYLKPEGRKSGVDANVERIEKKEGGTEYGIEQEMKLRDEIETKQQGDKLLSSMSDMTNRLPTFSAFFHGQDGKFQMTESVRETFVRLMGKGGQPQQTRPKPQRQHVQCQDFETQQVIDNHERMMQDQLFVDKIRRMQEAQIRERQNSNIML